MPYGDTTEATQVRREKAEVKRKLKSRELTLSEMLLDIPTCMENMPTLFVLDMLPHVGRSTLAEVNYQACKRGINLALPLGAITERAKGFLSEWDYQRREKYDRYQQKSSKRKNGISQSDSD